MAEELFDRINERYVNAGFTFEEKTEYYVKYRNRFSVHFIFISENLDEAKSNLDSFLGSLYEDYLKGKSSFYIDWPDVYWNFYAIFVVNISENEEFVAFKDVIESNTKISRKYVITRDELDLLPPSFWRKDGKRDTKETQLWENEWKEIVGEKLYYEIMDKPKSKIEDILWRYVNARISKTK